MDDPAGNWTGMAAYLRSIAASLPEKPKAILVVSSHWETRGFAFTGAATPPLIYDYGGFPAHTYEIRYDAPGDPALATRAADLLREARLTANVDPTRGLDHGVFIPMKVAFPDADIPVVEMSVDRDLDPALHAAAGRALAPLRDEGVLIVGSGMSFHNMRAYGGTSFSAISDEFDEWLTAAVESPPPQREQLLSHWEQAPQARQCHPPRAEEHLIPLMVAAGAGYQSEGQKIYSEHIMETTISAFRFG